MHAVRIARSMSAESGAGAVAITEVFGFFGSPAPGVSSSPASDVSRGNDDEIKVLAGHLRESAAAVSDPRDVAEPEASEDGVHGVYRPGGVISNECSSVHVVCVSE